MKIFLEHRFSRLKNSLNHYLNIISLSRNVFLENFVFFLPTRNTPEKIKTYKTYFPTELGIYSRNKIGDIPCILQFVYLPQVSMHCLPVRLHDGTTVLMLKLPGPQYAIIIIIWSVVSFNLLLQQIVRSFDISTIFYHPKNQSNTHSPR